MNPDNNLEINMPIQCIKIGDISIGSKDLPWDIIKKSANILKKYALWNPDEKYWKVTWKFFAFFQRFLKELSTIIGDYDESYIKKLQELYNKIRESIPKYIENVDSICFFAENFNPFSIAEIFQKKYLYGKIRNLTLDSIGTIPIPVICIKRAHIQDVLADSQLKSYLTRSILKILDAIGNEQKECMAYPVSSRYLIIELNKKAPESLLKDLLELGIIEFYSESKTDNYVRRRLRVYKKWEKNDRIFIKLPSYAFAFLESIFQKYKVPIKIHLKISFDKKLNVSSKIDLKNHQINALNSWLKNDKKGTIAIPTGGGKTHIALAAIAKLQIPTIIFVPNTILLKQWAERIHEFLGVPISNIGILGKGENKIKEITVSTYQSGIKYIDDISQRFLLAIFDEAHHVPARTFKNVALYLRAPCRMALSATPKRRDRNEVLLFKLVGKIVFTMSYPELVKAGILAPVILRRIFVPLPPDRIKKYRLIQRQLYRTRDHFAKKTVINKLIEIARDNPYKIQVIKEILKKHSNDKIFIFAGSINFAEEIFKNIRNIIPTAVLTSRTDSKEKLITKRFDSGILRCLILVKKGEEGVDISDANIAIIAGGSKQEREFIQRVGRVLRGKEGKIAWVYEIVTKDTIDEQLSKSRNAKKLVGGIENLILKMARTKAYDEIFISPLSQIELT